MDFIISKWLSHPLVLSYQESLDELKLVVGDSFENVASIQDCHFQQRDSVQSLGKSPSADVNTHRDGQMFPGTTAPAVRKQQSLFVRVTLEAFQRIPHLCFSQRK